MFDRFTDRSRKAMSFARQEAERFNHDYIGTEHILLGILKEGSGVAANVLAGMNVDLERVRVEIEKLLKPKLDPITIGQLPFTPRAKKVLEYAIDEARALDYNYVGTEHLLLGLMRVSDGLAAQVLMNFGLKIEDVRVHVVAWREVPLTNRISETQTIPKGSVEPFVQIALDALKQARALGHAETLSEHVLLALLNDREGLAGKILAAHDLELEALRAEIVKRRGEEGARG